MDLSSIRDWGPRPANTLYLRSTPSWVPSPMYLLLWRDKGEEEAATSFERMTSGFEA